MKMLKSISNTILLSTMLVFSLLLTSCVTETDGGFNVETSDDNAVVNYLGLAMRYLEQGDLANTRRHLDNVMAIDPKNSDAYGVLGLLHSREGDVKLADDAFKRSLRIDSTNSRARNNYAAFLFSNGRYEDAYKQLERVVEDTSYTARSQAFENMGMAALGLDNTADAERAFGRALQLNPNQLRSTMELIDINLNKGDIPQATRHYNSLSTLMEFYEIDPSARSLWLNIKLLSAQGGSTVKINEFAGLLKGQFPDSAEYKLYQQSMSGSASNE